MKIRAFKPEDFNFIIKTMLESLRYSSGWFNPSRNDFFFSFMNPKIEAVIKRSDVIIMCLEEDEDVILGFLISEKISNHDILHYVFVKADFRKYSIAKQLMQASDIGESFYHTFSTHMSKELLKKYPMARFNPYFL